MGKPLALVLAAPFFLGFLVVPWMSWRAGLPPSTGRRTERAAAVAIAVGLYGALAASGTAQALLTAWSLPSAGVNRLLPVLWAVFSLPAWALALIHWPDAACHLLHRVGAATAWRGGECRALGWLLLGAAALVAAATGLAMAPPPAHAVKASLAASSAACCPAQSFQRCDEVERRPELGHAFELGALPRIDGRVFQRFLLEQRPRRIGQRGFPFGVRSGQLAPMVPQHGAVIRQRQRRGAPGVVLAHGLGTRRQDESGHFLLPRAQDRCLQRTRVRPTARQLQAMRHTGVGA